MQTLLIPAFLSIVLVTILLSHMAFADGGYGPMTLPPSAVKSDPKTLALSVTTSPELTFAGANQDIFLHFRLYDAKTNETIKYSNLLISIYKGLDPKAKPLMQDAFVSQNGLLTLKVKPQPGAVQVQGNKDAFTNAWQADPGGYIYLNGPLFLDSGIYHIVVRVLGTDYPTNIFADNDVVKFDSYVHLGEQYKANVRFEDRDYTVVIDSYYDKVQRFNFIAGTETISWSVPFDWKAAQMQKENATTILMRQDIKIPKSILAVGDFGDFNATVNGVPLATHTLSVDHIVDPQNVIFRIALDKNEILDIAKKNNYTAVANSPHLMNFSFSFAPAVKTSSRITTDKGDIGILLNWVPAKMAAFQSSTLQMQFINLGKDSGNNSSTSNDTRIHDDVKYDITIYDNMHEPVFSASDQIAKDGAGNQTVRISADGGYQVEVAVKGTIKSGQSIDMTRKGIAVGAVLVPEFPISFSIFLSVGMVIAIIVLTQRFGSQLCRKTRFHE